MISFIVKKVIKVKNISALSESLLESESFVFRSVFYRTVSTQNALLTRAVRRKINKTENLFGPKSEEEFGKVIDLGEDFEEVREYEIKKKQKREVKTLRQNSSFNLKNNEETSEDKENKSKQSSKLSDRNEQVKGNINVLKKNSGLFCSIMTELKSKKNRKKHNEVIIEGKRLIVDALSVGAELTKLFYSKTSDLEKLNVPKEAKIYKIPYKSLKLWSDVVTPQGIVGVFKTPRIITPVNSSQTLPLTIICDNVRDAGNLGSMLRVVAGVGCQKLILTQGCVDIWNPKVLRAAAGAHFRLSVITNLDWSDIKKEISENSCVFLADCNNNNPCGESSINQNLEESNIQFKNFNNNAEHLPLHCYYSLKYKNESTVIIIGGETEGLSNEAYQFAFDRKGYRIFIPMENKVESLNNSVALGIFTYEFRRQLDSLHDAENHMRATEYGP